MTEPPDRATNKEKFELLFDALAKYHDGFIDSAFKVAGFFLLATGWILTSENARKFLGGDKVARLTAMLALPVAALVYAVTSYRVVTASEDIAEKIAALNYVDATVCGVRQLTRRAMWTFVAAICALCAFIAVLVYRLQP